MPCQKASYNTSCLRRKRPVHWKLLVYSSFKAGERHKRKLIMRFIFFITAAVTVSTTVASDIYFLCPYQTEGECCLDVNLRSGTGSLCSSSVFLRFPTLPFKPIQAHWPGLEQVQTQPENLSRSTLARLQNGLASMMRTRSPTVVIRLWVI
jgi:hypothetical protein